jgi:hypothetical protein
VPITRRGAHGAQTRRNADRPSDRHPPRHEPGFGVNSGGHMRLMIIEKGSVNAAVFIAFQKRESARRLALTGQDDFDRKVRSSVRQRQNEPEKIRSFVRKPSLKYAT